MSSSAGTVNGGPPIVDAVAQIHGLLDSLTHAPAWSMSETETRSTLVAVTRAAARVAELELRVAAQAETVRVGDACVPPRWRHGGPT